MVKRNETKTQNKWTSYFQLRISQAAKKVVDMPLSHAHCADEACTFYGSVIELVGQNFLYKARNNTRLGINFLWKEDEECDF
jgi:hypothetical protein